MLQRIRNQAALRERLRSAHISLEEGGVEMIDGVASGHGRPRARNRLGRSNDLRQLAFRFGTVEGSSAPYSDALADLQVDPSRHRTKITQRRTLGPFHQESFGPRRRRVDAIDLQCQFAAFQRSVQNALGPQGSRRPSRAHEKVLGHRQQRNRMGRSPTERRFGVGGSLMVCDRGRQYQPTDREQDERDAEGDAAFDGDRPSCADIPLARQFTARRLHCCKLPMILSRNRYLLRQWSAAAQRSCAPFPDREHERRTRLPAESPEGLLSP